MRPAGPGCGGSTAAGDRSSDPVLDADRRRSDRIDDVLDHRPVIRVIGVGEIVLLGIELGDQSEVGAARQQAQIGPELIAPNRRNHRRKAAESLGDGGNGFRRGIFGPPEDHDMANHGWLPPLGPHGTAPWSNGGRIDRLEVTMTSSVPSQPSPPPEHASGGDRFRAALDICSPYVVGVFDLSARGGPEHTVVVRTRSAAHTRKLATRLGDSLAAAAEGEAPDGTEPWIVVDADDVVVHLLTEASLHRYGLIDLFGDRSDVPDDIHAVVAVERLRRAWASRSGGETTEAR